MPHLPRTIDMILSIPEVPDPAEWEACAARRLRIAPMEPLLDHILSAHADSFPNLTQLRREGAADAERIAGHERTARTHTREAVTLWLRQAERCWIAAEVHHLKGPRFEAFATDIGIDRSTAYELVKLHPRHVEILQTSEDQGYWPTLPELLGHDDRVRASVRDARLHEELDTARARIIELETKAKRLYGLFTRDGNQETETPQWFFDHYNRQFHFDLDVAATAENAKCARYFTKKQNGLVEPWHGNCWMNPPFHHIEAWDAKAWDYAQTGEGIVAGLLPFWPSAPWFAKYAVHGQIRLLTRRIKFVGTQSSAPFDLMVVIWSEHSQCEGGRLNVVLEDVVDPTRRRKKPTA